MSLTELVNSGTAKETRKLGDSAAFELSVPASNPENPQKNVARAGATPWVAPTPTPPSFDTGNSNSVLQGSVAASSHYREVISTPTEVAEAMDFFAGARASETVGQSKRANSLHGSVFSLMQWRRNPRTGLLMFTQEQLDSGLATLLAMDVLELHADIWQDKDVYNSKGAEQRTAKGFGQVEAGDLVPLHAHITLKLKLGSELTVRQVSDAFAIPSARIKLPREAMSDAPQGRGAAMKAFLDLTAYLTHELCAGDASA